MNADEQSKDGSRGGSEVAKAVVRVTLLSHWTSDEKMRIDTNLSAPKENVEVIEKEEKEVTGTVNVSGREIATGIGTVSERRAKRRDVVGPGVETDRIERNALSLKVFIFYFARKNPKNGKKNILC